MKKTIKEDMTAAMPANATGIPVAGTAPNSDPTKALSPLLFRSKNAAKDGRNILRRKQERRLRRYTK
jgi:hypothetical protein